MIVCMPITGIAKKYTVPFLSQNIPSILLLFACFILLIWWGRTRDLHAPHKKYIVFFSVWMIVCTFIGGIFFPFWTDIVNSSLKDSRSVQIIIRFFPEIENSLGFLHGVYTLSAIKGVAKDIVLPLFALFLIIFNLYGKSPEKGMKWISKAALVLAILMGVYSLFEIYWIWTGDSNCASILKAINYHLYDPMHSNGWWPPELWHGRLRSYAQEPSFFGIIASFIIPLLWYRIGKYDNRFEILFLVYFTFMVFMTKAKTATVIYLGEVILFLLLSLITKYNHWIKRCVTVCAITTISFCVYLSGTFLQPYLMNDTVMDQNQVSIDAIGEMSEEYIKNNITSVAGTSSGSNTARLGNTIAMAKVGLTHPIFGVGNGFVDMYMVNQIPEFAQNDNEIKKWTYDMLQQGFAKSGYPVLNTFSAITAEFGVPGILLFLFPLFYLLFTLIRCRKQYTQQWDILCLVVALGGQIACLLSNWFFYSFPIIFSLLYCYIFSLQEKFK